MNGGSSSTAGPSRNGSRSGLEQRLGRSAGEAMGAPDEIRELVTRAQQGERDPFDALARRYRAQIEAAVRARLGPNLRVHASVDDVIQETFLRAWDAIARFQWIDERAFIYWLRGIALRIILEIVNRHRGARVEMLQNDIAVDPISPGHAMRREERFAVLEAALDQLPPDYRAVITSVRLEGLSVTETAKRMCRTPNAVSHLLLRALRQLRHLLADTESLGLPTRRLYGGEPDAED